jgi:hypothetical protein
MKIEIDDELATKIIVEDLKRSFIQQQEDISRLLNKGVPLRIHEQQDLWDFKDTSEAIAKVLQYYMYRPEADAFIKEHKVP